MLTFGANGSYSYHAIANASGTDVFNYTITDGDGDTSPSTLTIAVTNGQPSVTAATHDGERGGAGYVTALATWRPSGDGLDPGLDGGDDDGHADVL